MAGAGVLRELGVEASRWWMGLDRGWRAVILGHLVAAVAWVVV